MTRAMIVLGGALKASALVALLEREMVCPVGYLIEPFRFTDWVVPLLTSHMPGCRCNRSAARRLRRRAQLAAGRYRRPKESVWSGYWQYNDSL